MQKYFVDTEHLKLVEKNIQDYNIQFFEIPDEMLVKFGCSPDSIPGAIDLNKFIACFPKLGVKQGYVLDYILDYYICGSRLYVYARKKDELPILTTNQYKERFQSSYLREDKFMWTKPFIDFLEIDKSLEGLFDLALFLRILQTVYLVDHGCYNFRRFIYTKSAVESIIATMKDPMGFPYYDEILPIKTMDIRPYFVNKSGDTVLHLFSESAWDGISLEQILFKDKSYPFIFKSETVLEHSCHILF